MGTEWERGGESSFVLLRLRGEKKTEKRMIESVNQSFCLVEVTLVGTEKEGREPLETDREHSLCMTFDTLVIR